MKVIHPARWSFALGLVVLISGCVSTQAVRLGSGPIRPPISADKVAIYRAADQVPGRYEEVALLSSSGDQDMTNEESLYASMRKKAGQLGANGVILQSVKDASTAAQIGAALGFGSANRKGKAIAIFIFPMDSTAKKP
jgi:hypothetical protein